MAGASRAQTASLSLGVRARQTVDFLKMTSGSCAKAAPDAPVTIIKAKTIRAHMAWSLLVKLLCGNARPVWRGPQNREDGLQGPENPVRSRCGTIGRSM